MALQYFNNTIEDLFQRFESILNKDHSKYKNHVYRVFLNCLLIDNETSNREKYAIAAVFHDIGIRSNHTIDYLEPSIEKAKFYLMETGKQEWTEEIALMIYWHHKRSNYEGKYNRTVEVFRKADWIDVSLGLKRFGFEKRKIRANRKAYPNLGFHFFLLKKITMNFFRHPLNPLPMFKKKI